MVRSIDKKLNPEKYNKSVDIVLSHNTNDDDEEMQIEEYLLEYVRQIERYDKIRAANKLRAQRQQQEKEMIEQQRQQKLLEQYKPAKVAVNKR